MYSEKPNCDGFVLLAEQGMRAAVCVPGDTRDEVETDFFTCPSPSNALLVRAW